VRTTLTYTPTYAPPTHTHALGAFKFIEAFVVEACCSLTVSVEKDNSHGTVMDEKLTVIGEKDNSHGTVTGTHVDSPRSDMSSSSDSHESSDGVSDSDSTASENEKEKEVEKEKVQKKEKEKKQNEEKKEKMEKKDGAGSKRKAEVAVTKAVAALLCAVDGCNVEVQDKLRHLRHLRHVVEFKFNAFIEKEEKNSKR